MSRRRDKFMQDMRRIHRKRQSRRARWGKERLLDEEASLWHEKWQDVQDELEFRTQEFGALGREVGREFGNLGMGVLREAPAWPLTSSPPRSPWAWPSPLRRPPEGMADVGVAESWEDTMPARKRTGHRSGINEICIERGRAVAPGSGLLVNRIPDLNEVATRLAKLAPSDLQRLYSDLARAGRSPKSIRNYHSCIHAMLEKAVRLGLLVRNVATMVDLPRRAYRGLPMVTLQQARAFLQVAGKHRLEALFVLAITTGARQGELLGLTWDRANLGKAITVGCPE